MGLLGSRAIGVNKDEDSATGLGVTATLAGAIETAPNGIIIAICGRGHDVTISVPDGWTQLWVESETGGGGAKVVYKYTDGTALNPVFIIGDPGTEWAVACASYYPALAGNQVIWMM